MRKPAAAALALLVLALVGCRQKPAAPAQPAAQPLPVPSAQAEPAAPAERPAPAVKPTPARLDLQAFDLPKGYSAVAAIGENLVLLQLENGPEERLVLFTNGKITETIAVRPWNHYLSYGADDRFFVWSESETDASASQNDRWRIWAWDSSTGKSFAVARYDATAAAMQLPIDLDVGPTVKVSAGRVLWSSVDRTPAGPAVRLHLFDLAARRESVLAEGHDDRPLGGFDIRGGRIAYCLGDQLLLLHDDQKEVVTTAPRIGLVALTDDAVIWGEWPGRLMLGTSAGPAEVTAAESTPLLLSAGSHFVTWYSLNDDNLYLVHTPDGRPYLAGTGTLRGGGIVGDFVTWGVRDETSHPPRTRAARLPVQPEPGGPDSDKELR